MFEVDVYMLSGGSEENIKRELRKCRWGGDVSVVYVMERWRSMVGTREV